MRSGAVVLAQVLLAAFLSAAFLPLAVTKLLDWRGTRASWQALVVRTPLRVFAGLTFFALLVLEFLAGSLCAAGLLALVVTRDTSLALAGAALGALATMSQFFMERLAREVEGAARTTLSFVVAVVAVLVLGER